jgi:hypothetical protein
LAQALKKSFLTSNLGVYSEVRGKYARPAPQLNQIVKNPVLNRPTTAGSLRPKSSHGLPEAKINENNSNFQDFEENVGRPHSSMDFRKRPSSRSRKSRKSQSIVEGKNIGNELEKKTVRIDEKVAFDRKNIGDYEKLEDFGGKDEKGNFVDRMEKNGEVDGKEMKSLKEDEFEGNDLEVSDEEKDFVKDEMDKVNVEASDKSTSRNSWRTTSSHRRYVFELETLLREEKLKRIRLEELLQSIISK